MALYDWNKNGKKDMADDFMEYQIYKDCKKPSTGNGSSGSGSGIYKCGPIYYLFIDKTIKIG